ncbi:hypothetical protein OQA88_10817 [Cercophora sp. LCS_1]
MEGVLPAQPWSSPTARLKVPYLLLPTYLPWGVSFYGFPGHHGVHNTEDPAALAHTLKTTTALASFMQAWLFFELISVFLGFSVQPSDFVEEGFVNLDREIVHGHFRRWKANLWKLPYAEKKRVQQGLASIIPFALSKSDILEEAASLCGPDETFDRVALSTKLLANLLTALLNDTFSQSTGIWAPWARRAFGVAKSLFLLTRPNYGQIADYVEPDEYMFTMKQNDVINHIYSQQGSLVPLPPGDSNGGRAASRLIKLLEDNGWCPYRARLLCQTYDYVTLNSLAGLLRPGGFQENHQHCMQLKRCSAHELAVGTDHDYRVRHDCGNGGCEIVSVDYEAVAGIIRSGGIPVISVSRDGALDLRVTRLTPTMTYTAISHVWSDGLGNPTTNTLPFCQLLRLREMICRTYDPESSPFHEEGTVLETYQSRLQWELAAQLRPGRPHCSLDKKRVYFWIDTLCIPVSADQSREDGRDLRFRAIKKITPIFAGAFNVLILDKALQQTNGINPRTICGDELACLLLGSKWMERGWTLEEGCLSQFSVVQMLGKPYQLETSLKHLVPKVEKGHSPLQRAFIQSRRAMVLHLKRALQEDKKHISVDPWLSRAARLWKQLRVPQFVWMWNALLDRSTTRPSDAVLILATLLDFSVYPLRLVPSEERLMSVIQSCDELPLSLLYHAGPKVCIKGHPELSWIPKSVDGDRLVVGASLRQLSKSNGQVTFTIERPLKGRDTLLVLATSHGRRIPHEVETFRLFNPLAQGHNIGVGEYIIEVLRPVPASDAEEALRSTAKDQYEQSLGTCIVVDLACGTERCRGIAGRGALFYVDGREKNHMKLQYDAPLVAWTPQQWARKREHAQIPAPSFELHAVPAQQRLMMSYDISTWHTKSGLLPRRPMFTQHPTEAKLIALTVFMVVLIAVTLGGGWLFITVRDALGFVQRRPLPIGSTIVSLTGPLIAALIYSPIRKRVAMFSYKKWMKSFDEPQDLGDDAAASGSFWWYHYSFIAFFMLFGRRVRTVAGTIPLLLWGRRGSAEEDELPGDIRL